MRARFHQIDRLIRRKETLNLDGRGHVSMSVSLVATCEFFRIVLTDGFICPSVVCIIVRVSCSTEVCSLVRSSLCTTRWLIVMLMKDLHAASAPYFLLTHLRFTSVNAHDSMDPGTDHT